LIASCLQQVLGSFIIFEITWPGVVLSGIAFLKNVGDFIQIDLLEIPGLACPWASYSYETKFHVSMATPLVISVMLMMPVPVAYFLAREYEKKRNLLENSQPVDVAGGGFEQPQQFGFRDFGSGGFGQPPGYGQSQYGGQSIQPGYGQPGGSPPGYAQPVYGRGGDFGGGGFGQPQSYAPQQETTSAEEDINSAEEDINWRLRYEKTVNTFMNNIMCVHSCDLFVELSFILTVKACVHV
jgi:hypothetical protein